MHAEAITHLLRQPPLRSISGSFIRTIPSVPELHRFNPSAAECSAGLADFHRRWRISLRPETDKMYSAITHRNYIIYPPDGFVNRARAFFMRYRNETLNVYGTYKNRFEKGKWVECAECDESRRSKAVCLTRRCNTMLQSEITERRHGRRRIRNFAR